MQHRAELIGARFLPGRARRCADRAVRIGQRFGDPLGLDLEPLLAVGADLGERERGAIHLRGFAEQTQHFGHRLHGVGRFQQQAAGLGRGRQQPFALQQVLGVEDALGRGGEVDGVDAHGRGLYSRKAIDCHLPQLGCGRSLPTPAQGLVDGNQAGGGLGTAAGQLILGLEQGPLGIQHLQEVAGAVFITYARQARGRIAGRTAASSCTSRSRARAWVTSESSVSSSAWSTVFSYRSSAPSLRALGGADARLHVAVVEDAPGNAGREHVGIGAAVAERHRTSRPHSPRCR